MTLRHSGLTTYSADKVWADDGDASQRPAVTYTLWRYSTNGGSPATATQATLVNKEGSEEFVTLTLPAGSDTNVDLDAMLREKYGIAEGERFLDRYDPDGYPYVYALREDAVSGYEIVYGTIGADGAVSGDTGPNYLDSNDDPVYYDRQATRPSNDRFIYNGATVTNRRTGQVTVEGRKTWVISAFQDSLTDVTCTFTAQWRHAGSDEEWQDVGGADGTVTLTGWHAETLTKQFSGTFDRYDENGHELEYRWVETGVAFGGQDTNFRENEDGSASFELTVTSTTGEQEQLSFVSTPTVNDDGTTTITNTFQNTTEEHVDKYWEQPDGSMAQVRPDLTGEEYADVDNDGIARIQLFRDNELIGTFEMDGEIDAAPTEIPGLEGATYQETSPYHIDFELPKYSESGARYNYLVLETQKDGWYATRTYDPDTATTRIDNHIAEGESSEIRITKRWLDGDDDVHRPSVIVNLYAAHDMQSQTLDENGDPRVSYREGQLVASNIELSAANSWYAEVGVGIGNLDQDDFYAEEVSVVENGKVYPVVSMDEARAQYGDVEWINVGWSNPENERVATTQHVYEVRSTRNDEMGSVEVTNRRLGIIDLDVTKEWIDGLGTDPDGIRPDAVLTVYCEGANGPVSAFSVDGDGNVWVQVSGNRLPVLNGTGDDARQYNVNTDEVQVTGGELRVTVDTTQEKGTYVIAGLPKYDAQGYSVTYSVEESFVGDQGDYHNSVEVGDYQTSALHFHDTQSWEITNTRSGTTSVQFHKEWKDQYVYEELGQRPDIYLTLYRTVDGGTPEVVDGYVDYLWEASTRAGGGDSDLAADLYGQTCTINGLPAYDSLGREYTYYAEETMAADSASLNYADVTFDTTGVVDKDEAPYVKVDADAEADDPVTDQNGTGWAIQEGGTFVNTLTSNVIANGTKVWEDVPGNVSQDDLPDVTVYIQQRVKGDTSWEPMTATRQADGSWKVDGYVAETSTLTEVTTNQYSYHVEYKGDNDSLPANPEPLPRFTEDGRLYEYRAVEVVWGLEGVEGAGFPTGDSFQITDGSDDQHDVSGNIYVVQHGEAGSFILRNVYQAPTGQLTVKKAFSGRDAGDAYPDVTYRLYRYYEHDGQRSESALVEARTITAEQFAAADSGDGNAEATCTFDDLEMLAPSGDPWVYYVTEEPLGGGYETTVGMGDLEVGSDQLKASAETDEGIPSGTMSDDVVAKNDDVVDVTFANDYDEGNCDLSGTKRWNDYGNVFGTRPDEIGITLSRSAGPMTEQVELQSDDPDGANYLSWVKDADAGSWSFTIENVEEWAPNGQRWEYTVTETLPSGYESSYVVTRGTSSATAGTSDSLSLVNSLKGGLTASKTWVDGEDPYGLRPETVEVTVQARVEGSDDPWQDAYGFLKAHAAAGTTDDDTAAAGFTPDSFVATLDYYHGWQAEWNGLPLTVKSASGQVVSVEYRVVETKIGDQEITPPTASESADANIYTTYGPYQPSQETTEKDDAWSTVVTNTLDSTSVSATKTWAADVDDAWGTRPTDGGTWTVTYFLQRRLAETDTEAAGPWEWVVEAGAEPADSAIDDGVVSLTISDTDGTETATWKDLPETDTQGRTYEYRVVEQVPGGYDVQGATQVPDADTAHRYFVVSGSSTGAVQTFTNEMRTVDLTGTKLWSDDAPELVPDFDSGTRPTMVLWRSVEGGDPEKVTYDGGSPAQPTWTEVSEGEWTFTYENLPAADHDDKPYTYWAVEQDGTVPGFHPVYATEGADGTQVAGDQQTGTEITNEPNRLTLSKVSDVAGDDAPRDVELTVLSPDGSRTYAVWTVDEDGTTSARVWAAGTDDPSDATGSVETDGEIWGLRAGTYVIRETSNPPEGFALAEDVTITVAADGSVTSTTQGAVSGSVADGTINVEVEDPVFRGHFEITKTVTNDEGETSPLAGATFDLYRSDGTKVAEGITIGADGTWSSEDADDVTFLTEEDGHRTTLADGLLPGEYYLVETNSTPGAVLPPSTTHYEFEIEADVAGQPTHHQKVVEVDVENEAFEADVVLMKYDATPGAGNAGIDGAEFTLYWTPEGSSTEQELGTYTTETVDGKAGTLVLPDLQKGSYRLVESANPGYDIEGERGFEATFVLGNEDEGQTFRIPADASKIDFQALASGSGIYDPGVPNWRETGSVTLEKLGGLGDDTEPLDGVTFDLQRLDGGEWVTVVEDLQTGRNYEMNEANTGVGRPTRGDSGQLRVTGLQWGTYRLVESGTLEGYVGQDGQGWLVSDQFTIDRHNLDHTLTGDDAVVNVPTRLVIHKENEDGVALRNTTFTVTPVDGSTFVGGGTGPVEIRTGRDGNASLVGQLLVGGTYAIEETDAPNDYDPVEGTLTVKVAADGTLEVQGEMPEGYARLDGNGYSFSVTNEFVCITISKVDSTDGHGLEGVLFVMRTDGAGPKNYTTGPDGTITIDRTLTQGHTYTLEEMQTIDGYLRVMGSMEFTIGEDGEIDVVGELPAGYEVSEDGVAITVQNEPTGLELLKVDPDGNALPGATFTVTPVDGTTFVGGGTEPVTITTGADGLATMRAQLMVGGTYDITESDAPEGYLAAEGTMRVYVAADGTLQSQGSVVDGQVVGNLPPTGYTKVDSNRFQVQVTNEPIVIGLAKVDAEDTSVALAGATFEVEGRFAGASGVETRSYTTDETGRLDMSAELAAGETYALTETVAPAGYELAEGTVEFTVQEDGTIVAAADLPAAYAIEQGNLTIVALDEPLRASIVKQGEDGGALSGAEFTVEGPFPNGDASRTFTSSSDGTVVDGVQLTGSAEGTRYTVTETRAPEGYEAIPAFDVLVFDDGTVRIADDAPAAARESFSVADEDGTAVITLVDSLEPDLFGWLPKTGEQLLPYGIVAAIAAVLVVAGLLRSRRKRG